MGLLGNLITKGVTTAARNSTIKAVGAAASKVIVTASRNPVPHHREVVVVKNGITHIKPTRSSEDYCGENALDIAHELLGAGFESVMLKPIHRLGALSKKRYGEVTSVTINGKDDFFGIMKFPASSNIVIKYLDFKTDVDPDVYIYVQRIPSKMARRVTDIEATEQDKDTSSHCKNFCSYCGATITKTDAMFCSNCGREL